MSASESVRHPVSDKLCCMPQQVTLGRRAYFSAGRELHRADWSREKNHAVYGRDTFPHGHDYVLTVFYTGVPRGEDGMIVNLSDIKPILSKVLAPLQESFLSELPTFKTQPPTLETLAQHLWNQLPTQLGNGALTRLQLQESSSAWIDKTAETMKLTRRYEFAAAHRLHAPQLSDEENFARYGNCNNPRGHGHNYGLEVTIEGEPDPDSGMLIAQHVLDAIIKKEIFERFDHKHLNEDCPEFAELIPTSENLALVIFNILAPLLQTDSRRLVKVGLHETQKNYFEVEAP